MKLDHLYALRRDFTVIGLTGRTGSGCTTVAEILSSTFNDLSIGGLRPDSGFSDGVFLRKYQICKKFLGTDDNWTSFETIKYVNVLLFFILYHYGGDITKTNVLFRDFFKEENEEDNTLYVTRLMRKIKVIDTKYRELIKSIQTLPAGLEIRQDGDLKLLNSIFFGAEYTTLVTEILGAMEIEGYYRTRVMLHKVAINIRNSGDPIGKAKKDISNIYLIAQLLNSLIKARRNFYKELGKPTKIVIDSLRNSLEIMFFKQRFSAFYMVATKDILGNAKQRLDERLKVKILDGSKRSKVVDALLALDEVEYKTNDFSKGNFSSPDVENCIQKSDYHVLNLKKEEIPGLNIESNDFLTCQEQVLKLVSLIQHPGLITPSSAERAMQIANTAKLNSGCISRKVGAVITDKNYFVEAVGWNDVANGHTPCSLRNVTDFWDGSLNSSIHYSEFEKGESSAISSYKYKGENPGDFKEALVDYFKEKYDENNADLKGKNCSFCFKTVHNHYEGEANQVHTRSLHAEENAMLQITQKGGVGVKDGFLFTTASPCELCSKKAYQLGITKIFYIDPYPGIAVDQILKGGLKRPVLVPFSGAIGNAYDWLYDSFMSHKDELAMTLELKPRKNLSKELKNLLATIDNSEIKSFIKDSKLDDKMVEEVLVKVITQLKS